MIFGKTKRIYLDNAATTQTDEAVFKAMKPFFDEKYGNASSQHWIGQEAKRALEESRETIARSIGARYDEIIFTSGGTESNNLTLKGLYFANKDTGKNHIITTKIEHDCVLNSCKWLESLGAKVDYLDVDEEGFIDLKQLKEKITDKTLVVSVIHGNNEVGTIQDIEAIGKITKEKGVLFHTDACQSYTKVGINVKKQNLDLVTLNAHKIHGPKGVGALYIRKGIKLTPLFHGGGHEYNIRSTTENIPGIVGFAKAVKIASPSHIKHMTKLRDRLIDGLLKIPNVTLNGSKGDKRLCNNINVSFNNIEGEAVGGYLDSYNICSSTGSACSSHSLNPSHVLIAMGLDHAKINTSVRLSVSKFNSEDDIDKTLEVIEKIVPKLRKMSPVKL